jgi:hypothetical protein
MNMEKRYMTQKSWSIVLRIVVTLSLFVFVIYGAAPLWAADHREAPKVDAIPEGDITDVFLFTDPNDASRVVMIMNVNPFGNPSENPSFSFSPDLLYQFKIDNNGDAHEDKVIQILFTGVGTSQTVQVFGPDTPNQTGARNALLHGPASASGKFGQVIGNPSGVLAFTGLRDDPFVFDVGQFFRILNGSQDVFRQIGTSFRGRPVRADGTSGVDGFGGFNLTSIVVSLPKSMLRGNSSKINMWATVSEQLPPRRANGRTWVQFERMGQQGFATVFIPGGLPRDLENEEIPEHDVANYSGLIPDALTTTDNDGTGNTIAGRAALLTALGLTAPPNGAPLLLPGTFGNTNKNLLRVALLPDVLRFDLDLPANTLAIGQFGLQSGRRLGDPVIDIALQLLRQLADVHFPNGVPGGGPVGSRAALECSNFPACQDRRVLVVVQGTDWIKPDNQLLDFTTSGNDRPFLTMFPYIAAPHPLPGDPGTVGFPAQQ